MGNEARVGLVLAGVCVGLALVVEWAIRHLDEPA